MTTRQLKSIAIILGGILFILVAVWIVNIIRDNKTGNNADTGIESNVTGKNDDKNGNVSDTGKDTGTGKDAGTVKDADTGKDAGSVADTGEVTGAVTDTAQAAQETADNWNPDFVFSTTDTKGNTVTDEIFKEARLTMLNYWAYWCGPCIGEMPDFEAISSEYADKGLQIIGVYDAAEEAEDIKALNELGITYRCIRIARAFYDTLNTGYIPTTIFVDENGKLIGQAYVGARSKTGWLAIIDELLK